MSSDTFRVNVNKVNLTTYSTICVARKGSRHCMLLSMLYAIFILQHFPLCGQMKDRQVESRLSRLVSDYKATATSPCMSIHSLCSAPRTALHQGDNDASQTHLKDAKGRTHWKWNSLKFIFENNELLLVYDLTQIKHKACSQSTDIHTEYHDLWGKWKISQFT